MAFYCGQANMKSSDVEPSMRSIERERNRFVLCYGKLSARSLKTTLHVAQLQVASIDAIIPVAFRLWDHV